MPNMALLALCAYPPVGCGPESDPPLILVPLPGLFIYFFGCSANPHYSPAL